MNRRKFGILQASSLASAAFLGKIRPASAAVNADLLKSTLTPMGGERAGNANGTIPAWTGGMTEVPAGWNPSTDAFMPDFFAADQKLYSVDSSNMAQYADQLADGTKLMMQKHGFRIDVYPTHRTSSAPQWIYDNTYKNVANTQMLSKGAKYGFTGAYGGPPFPILDSNPDIAGAQVIWNHATVWQGSTLARNQCVHMMDSSGNLNLASGYKEFAYFLYYQPGDTIADYNGFFAKYFIKFIGPAAMMGQESVEWFPTNTLQTPERVWSYLPGQGRMREDPDLTYDTPAPDFDGYANEDEHGDIFYGALDRYNWRLVGKKEMLVPYNNNKLYHATAAAAHLPHFLDPDLVRWELHRVWVVDAVVAPGKRNVIQRRRIYVDEDSWIALLGDSWDAQGNYWRHSMNTVENRPDLVCGTYYSTGAIYDLQANRYLTQDGVWNEAPYNRPIEIFKTPQLQLFNPNTMAAQAQF